MDRKAYPTDLTDAEWNLIKSSFPAPNVLGRPREVDFRELMNAVVYWVDNGVKWRALHHDFPCWQTVYGYFQRWVKTGLWQQLNHTLVPKVRQKEGQNAAPTLGVIDSKSVRGTSKGGPAQGVDGFKKVKGCKLHILVDVLGLILSCFVTAANQADVDVAPSVIVPGLDTYETIQKILADQGYKGELAEEVKAAFGCCLELTKKLDEGFVAQPWRWVVERTFGWLENARRLCRNYEELPETHEGAVYIAMIRLMLRRLTSNQPTRIASAAA